MSRFQKKVYNKEGINSFGIFPPAHQDIVYNAFDKVTSITEGNKELQINYGHHRQRIRQLYRDENGETTKTFAGNCEFVSIDGQQYAYTYLSGPTGLFAIHVQKPDGTSELFYIHTDHLGSLHTITDENGSLLQELSFDPWGTRRDPNTWTAFTGTAPTPLFDRGFTGHACPEPCRREHLDGFQLINMNGRLYDPVVSRMLSPDNYVQSPDFSQSFNRYSYAWNNPLVYTDPSGEFLTWSLGSGGLSIGINLTPIGIPLGAGYNIGWGDGLSVGRYVEVGYRVGGTGFGSGATVSQSLDYNFKHSNWSTTTTEGAYASLGPFNAGINFSQTYDMSSKQWSNGWGVSAGVGIGNDVSGIGFNVGYGSGGWTYGIGGFHTLERPQVYKSPISSNYGDQNGECVLRCAEEFSASYGMSEYDYNYWLEQNDGELGVHSSKVEGLIDNTGISKSDRIAPQSNINILVDAFTNDKRVLMGFKTESGGEHAVMVSKVKIWSSGRYKVYFKETSPIRIAPYSSTNLFKLSGAGFWTFYRN